MANAKEEIKETDPNKIDVDAAKEVVRQAEADEKDGKVEDKTVAGIVMKPAPGDASTWAYDGTKPEQAEEAKPEKSKYKSGEPVHDRS